MMFCKVCKATRETTSAGTCSSCGSSSVLHEYAAPGGVLRPDDFELAARERDDLRAKLTAAEAWEKLLNERWTAEVEHARELQDRLEALEKKLRECRPANTRLYRFDVGKQIATKLEEACERCFDGEMARGVVDDRGNALRGQPYVESKPCPACGGEGKKRLAKPAYSHMVRVDISRREAIDVMRTLLNQMTREDEPIGITLFGELAEDPEG